MSGDELVKIAAWVIHRASGCGPVPTPEGPGPICEPDREDWGAARAALDAVRDQIAAEALREAADDLSLETEGSERQGTATWPAPDRAIYSLAIEEAQAALRERADRITQEPA